MIRGVCQQVLTHTLLTLALKRFNIADADVQKEAQRLRSQQPGDDAILRREGGQGGGELPFEEWVGDKKMSRETTEVVYLPGKEQIPGADREYKPGEAPTEVIQPAVAPGLHAAPTAGGEVKIMAAPAQAGPQDVTLKDGEPGTPQEMFEDWVSKDQMEATPEGDQQQVIEGEIQLRTNVENFQQKLPDGVIYLTKITTTEHIKPLTHRTVVKGVESKQIREQLIGREIEKEVTELPPGVENPDGPGLERETSSQEFEQTLPNGVWEKRKVKQTRVTIAAPRRVEGEVTRRSKVETFEEKQPDGGHIIRRVTTTEHVRSITDITFEEGKEKQETKEQLIGKEIEQDIVELPPGVMNPEATGLQKKTANEEFEEVLPDGTWVLHRINRTRVIEGDTEVIEGEIEQRTNVETFEDKQPNGVTVIRKITTVEHVRPITEITYEAGEKKTETIEQVIGREIEEDVLELPPGVTDPNAEGLAKETATGEFEETLPDGSWVRKRINNMKVSQQETPQIIEGEVEHMTNVDTFEQKLDDGGLICAKITTTDHIRPITEVRSAEDVQTVEKFVGREIHEETVELPPGVKDPNAQGLEKETSVQAFDQAFPDGTWEKKKVSKTKMKVVPVKPTVIEGSPVLKTSMETFENKLDNGFVRITNVKITEHVKPITEVTIVNGEEKKKVAEKLIGREIQKDITDLPPGVKDSKVDNVKSETAVEEFDETLPNGVWQKTSVKKTTIKFSQQEPPKVIEGEIEMKTCVETFQEQLPEGVTLKTKRTTTEHIKPVTEIVTVDGVEYKETTEHSVGKEIVEDVTELPFGVIEPIGPGLSSQTSVSESEETLPDGTWEKKKVNKTVVVSQVASQVIEGDVEQRVSVDSFEEKLGDGSLQITKVTTIDHVRPITGTVMVKGTPQKQTTERFEGREIIQDVMQLPPGVTDPNAEGLEKESSVQAFDQILPGGIWEKKKITITKATPIQTEPMIIEGKPILKTSAETFEEKLDNGTIRKINVKTIEHIKPITELLVVKGEEKKKITEQLIGREIEEDWTELSPGVQDPKAPGLKSETTAEEFDATLADGVWEKKRVKKTTVKLPEQAPPEVTEGDIQLKRNVETFREQFPDGVTLLTQRTTIEHVKPITETIIIDGVRQQDTQEQFIGKEIIEDVTELPFGVIEPVGKGLSTQTSVQETEETLPDGTWEKKKVNKIVVVSHVAPEAVEGDLELRTNVETFENKLDDGSLVITKVTTVDHVRPITGTVLINDAPQQQTLERFEGREILEEVTELPSGVKDPNAEGIEKATSVETFQQTLPDGTWEKKKVTVTKATVLQPTIVEGQPILRTSVETFEDKLDNGTIRIRNVKTTEHVKPITEILIVNGIEKKKVTEELIGTEIEEQVTHLPPGVKDRKAEGLKTDTTVEQFESTLPDGIWEKKSVKVTTVKVSEQLPPTEGEIQFKTNVETFKEQLPGGVTLLTQRTTIEHIKPITETITIDGVSQQDTQEQFIGKEIIEDVTELPFGVIEPVGKGLSTQISVQETEETLPDGTWEKKKVNKTVVVSHVAPEAVEGDLELRTNVETFENKLDDGSLVITKVTTVDHVRPITGTVLINDAPQQQTLERFEGREILEEVTELPSGIKDPNAEGIEKATSVETFQQTLPDGTWEKKKVTVTKATVLQPTIVEGQPILRTSVETFEDKLDNGTIRIRNVKTTEHVKPITEILIVNGIEKKKVTEELIGTEIEEQVTHLPPGVKDRKAEGLKTDTTVEQFESTLPDGIWEKKSVRVTTVKVSEQLPPTEGEIQFKTNVETFKEQLPGGVTLLTQRTTIEHIKPITETITIDGVSQQDTQEQFIGKEIIEDVTELPFGVIEPVGKGLSTQISVQETEETLPDGTWEKKKVNKTVVVSHVAPEAVEGDLELRTNVETFENKLDDGSLVITKVTTVDHVRPITGTVLINDAPQQQTLERFEGREILEEVTELPSGVKDPNAEGIEKATSVETFQQTLPDGTWEKKKVTVTKATVLQPTIVEGQPILKTSVETFEDKLDNGTLRIRNVKVTEHVKPITEFLIVKGVEKKTVTEQLLGREIEENVKELPPGITDTSGEGVQSQTAVEEFESTLPDGIWEKKSIKTTKVKVESAAPKKVTKGDVEKRTSVENFEDKLAEGGIAFRKITTVEHVTPITEIVVEKGKEKKSTSEKPVGREIEEEITELPPGVTDPNFKGTGRETSVQTSEQTLSNGTWEKRVTRRTRVRGAPQASQPGIVEGKVGQRVSVQTYEERLGNGLTIIKKITTTEHVKAVIEVTVVGGVEQRTTKEQLLGRVIEENVTQLPPGVREPHGEGLEQDTSVEEFEESLPDGTWIKKIIRKTDVTRTTDQAPPQELTARPTQIAAEQLESTVAKTKISMEATSPQLQAPSFTRGLVMPEDALDVEEDEFEETLEDGTVINKRIITTRTATTVTKTIVTVMPDGSIKEEVIREEISGPVREKPPLPKQISDEIIPEEVTRPQALHEPPRQPIDDDLIVPDELNDSERAPPKIQKSVDEPEVVPQYKDKPDDLPSLIVGSPLTPGELDEVEETLPDGTVVKRRAMKTKVRKIITKKIRRVGPDGEVVEDVFTEEVPESDISETSSLRSGYSADARDVVSPIPYVSSPTELASPTDSIDSEKPSVRVYTDTIEGEPQVETDVQEFEETMPDGTVVKRKVIKTRQKQTIVKRVVMEGPESDLPTTEEQAQMMLNTSGSFDPEVQVYTDRMQTEPVESTDVQEFEETLPDGTVVKKKVVTKTEQQLKTERTLMEGTDAVIGLADGHDEDMIHAEDQSYVHGTPQGRHPQAGIALGIENQICT